MKLPYKWREAHKLVKFLTPNYPSLTLSRQLFSNYTSTPPKPSIRKNTPKSSPRRFPLSLSAQLHCRFDFISLVKSCNSRVLYTPSLVLWVYLTLGFPQAEWVSQLELYCSLWFDGGYGRRARWFDAADATSSDAQTVARRVWPSFGSEHRRWGSDLLKTTGIEFAWPKRCELSWKEMKFGILGFWKLGLEREKPSFVLGIGVCLLCFSHFLFCN